MAIPTYKQNQINGKLHIVTFSIHSILNTSPGNTQYEKATLVQ